MNYELLKQLKDAGFPQEGSNRDMCGDLVEKGTLATGFAYSPTLSELIEACGDGIMGIYFKSDNPEGKVCAWTRRWLTEDQYDKDVECFGATPEEAVARLWLTINKKV